MTTQHLMCSTWCGGWKDGWSDGTTRTPVRLLIKSGASVFPDAVINEQPVLEVIDADIILAVFVGEFRCCSCFD